MSEAPDQPGMSLRDAVKRLSPNPKNLEYSKLLGLLKAGRIKAGVRFPAPQPLWVKIPREFWLDVDVAEFSGRLRFDRDNPSSGTYKIWLADLANEIAESISQRSELENSKQWAAVIAVTGKQYEAEIIEQEWDRFAEVNSNDIAPPRAKGGRNPKKGWQGASFYIGVYIIRHYEAWLQKIRSGEAKAVEEIKSGEAGTAIYEIAKKAGTRDLPAAGTIQHAIAAILAETGTISSDK
jgi:hypothetical protein